VSLYGAFSLPIKLRQPDLSKVNNLGGYLRCICLAKDYGA